MFSLALTTASAAALGNGGATLAQVIASLYGDGSPGAFFDQRASSGYISKERYGGALATAVGDAVGFALDVSQGLAESAEVLTNVGGPFTVTTGYTAVTADITLSIVAGRLRATMTGTTLNRRIEWSFTAVVGKWYKVRLQTAYNVTSAERPAFAAWVGVNVSPAQAIESASPSTVTYYVQATATTVTLRYYLARTIAPTIGDYIELISASVVEVAGNHYQAPTDASRPLLADIGGGILVPTGDGIDDRLSNTAQTYGGNFSTLAIAATKVDDLAQRCIIDLAGADTARIEWPRGTSVIRASAWLGSAETRGAFATGAQKAVVTARLDRDAASVALQTRMRYNGVGGSSISGSVTASGAFGSRTVNLFATGTPSLYHNGGIAMAMAINRDLTADELSAVEAMFNAALGGAY